MGSDAPSCPAAICFVMIVCYLFGGGGCEDDKEAEETITSVMGVIGNRAALPCNITPTADEDAVALILWYKDDITKPIYSVDARKTSVEQARHVAGEAVASRVALSLDETPSILYLESLSEEDEGEYRCRVDFRRARSRNAIVFLQLVVPPKKPIITDHNGEILESLIGPYNEGDTLSLICEAEEGKPLPSVTWWRETVLLDDTYVVTPHGVVRNELEVPPLQRHDLMAVFTCQASNNNFSIPAYAAVTVDMNFRPVSVKMEGGPRPMSAEKPVNIACKSAGSKPPAVISWWMGTSRLKHNKDTVSADGNVTTSVLNFRPSMDDNGKQLTCRGENPLISASAIDDTWDLEIHYVPQLVLRLGSKLRHYHIQEGNDVYLECDIRANPPVTEVGWTFENRELHTNVSAGLIISNQSLVLQRVQKTNRGHYTCTASNSEGTGESKPLYLSVQYSPICKAGQKILYGATRHEEVKVVCEVEADPTDVSFRWSFNKSGENVDDVSFVSEGTKSTATVTAKTEYDYGTLQCWGSNSVGTQKEPCVYTVITAGPPDLVQNCTVMNRTQSSFRLECVEGSNGGLRQFFVMEVHDTVLHTLRDNQTADIPVFLARDLPPATSFVVVVYAVNAKGKSQAVVLRANTLDSRHKNLRKGSRWQVSTRILVAVLITVVVALLVAVVAIFMVRRAKRRLREQKRNMKRACGTPDALLKNGKDRNREICMCVADDEGKPPGMTPEVVVMSEIRSHSCIKNHIYCSSEIQPASPYHSETGSKPRRTQKKRNMFIRLHRSFSKKPQYSAPDVAQETGHQMRSFQSYSSGDNSPIERRESILTIPSAVDALQSTETIILDETAGAKHIERTIGEIHSGK